MIVSLSADRSTAGGSASTAHPALTANRAAGGTSRSVVEVTVGGTFHSPLPLTGSDNRVKAGFR